MPLSTDLQNLAAYLDEFEPFLKSPEVFQRVGAMSTALSLGSVLFLQRTLTARQNQFTLSQASQFAQLDAQLNTVLNSWRVHTEQKALKEVSNRLNVWGSAFDELGENYATTIQQRVYLELLWPYCPAAQVAPYQVRLQSLDGLLRARFNVGNFVWAEDLAAAFPKEQFWFLYGKGRG